MFRKLSKNHNLVFQLTTLKLVIDAIESNGKDGYALYQDQKVDYYLCEKKQNMQNHILEMVQPTISCFEKQCGNLYSGEAKVEVNANSDHGDRILFDVCCILNCNIWPKPTSNAETYIVLLNAFKNVLDCYSDMEVFKVFTIDDITEGFLAITSYAHRYFDIPSIKPMEFWSKMIGLHKDNISWKAVLLVVELCFCVPISNATLERLFGHMNLVKTTV